MAKYIKNYSPNFSVPVRNKKKIKFIIIHYTGMKKESKAIEKLCNEKSKVSAHYFIKKNGELINLVPDLYEAWHAGKSGWKNFKFLNKTSIGVEIQNQGHAYQYEKFYTKQIVTLKKLIKYLIKKYNINIKNILGHSDIAPARKKDPGEKFPWKSLSKDSLAIWHNLNEKKIKKYRMNKLSEIEKKIMLKNLNLIGYNNQKKIKPYLNQKILIKAFQRRYRQDLVNGISDKECLLISKNLLKS